MAKRNVSKGPLRSASGRKAVVRSSASGSVSMGLAIIALILNVVFISGLGTLAAGRSKTGAWQLFLFAVGAILTYFGYWYGQTIFYIGGPVMIAAWIWSLITGVQLIQEAR